MEIAVLANSDENSSLVEEVVIHKIKLLFFVVLHYSLYLIVAHLFSRHLFSFNCCFFFYRRHKQLYCILTMLYMLLLDNVLVV